ncbi:MAG TPA: hypothetical protein VN203_09550 [Candidatus Acidoferrum sp.]|nr:hypothetical protein [Candidatus Acidoferrum sp.]
MGPQRLRHLDCFCLLLSCLIVFFVAAPTVTFTAQATVPFRIQVIYAANEPGGVDNSLGGLADDLQRTFRYSMYRLLDSPHGSAALNQAWVTSLPGDRRLEIVPTAIQEGQYSLTVRVLAPAGQAVVNTSVRLKSGATVLVGGPTHQKGVLIIAITVA